MGDNFRQTAFWGERGGERRGCYILNSTVWKGNETKAKEMDTGFTSLSFSGQKRFALFATRDLVSWLAGPSLTVN